MSGFVRRCTVCLSRGESSVATFVASSHDALEWFECDGHDERDNVAELLRTSRVPIRQWFEARGLPQPETRMPPDWLGGGSAASSKP